MSFTLDLEVAKALAPFAPRPTARPHRFGDVSPRRAVLEGIFRYADTAKPLSGDLTVTDHKLITADGATIQLRWYAREDPRRTRPCRALPARRPLALDRRGLIRWDPADWRRLEPLQ